MLAPYLASPDPGLRASAAQLLACIPGSALVEQLWTVAQPFLSLTVQAARGPELRVSLPSRWQPDWQALGLEQQALHWGGGEAASWLSQMLRLLPPDRWSTHWHVAPRTLLQLATRLPIGPDIIAGWRSATYWHQQPEWALAFLEGHLTGSPATGESTLTNRFIPGEQAAALILPCIPPGARLSDTPAPWQQALLSIQAPWPRAVQRQVMDLLEDTLLDPPEGKWEEAGECIRTLVWFLEQEIDEADQQEVAYRLHRLLTPKLPHQERIRWALKMIHLKIHLRRSLEEPPGSDD
ncbi:hypothetical protein DNI29_23040 [Hymenobacter sediminis]|nr:hypothetical protein DNI29_23040 [Hymenobacter sediminis]